MPVLHRLFIALAVLSMAATLYLDAKVREQDRLVSGLISEALGAVPATDTLAVVRALAEAIYRRTNAEIGPDGLSGYERIVSLSPLNMDAGTSLGRGVYGVAGHHTIGPCGTMTRTLLVSLRTLDLPARKVQLYDDRAGFRHTMVEYREGGRWRAISPSDSGFTWRNHAGEVATVEEVLGDSVVFAQIYERFPGYPVRFTRSSGIRWDKLPAPVRSLFRGVMGAERYERARTPALYDQPREFLRLGSLMLAALFSALALGAWLTARRADPATRATRTGLAASGGGLIK